jgi:hypothetical protein
MGPARDQGFLSLATGTKIDPLQFPGDRFSEVNAIALRNYTLTTQVSNIGRRLGEKAINTAGHDL